MMDIHTILYKMEQDVMYQYISMFSHYLVTLIYISYVHLFIVQTELLLEYIYKGCEAV